MQSGAKNRKQKRRNYCRPKTADRKTRNQKSKKPKKKTVYNKAKEAKGQHDTWKSYELQKRLER